MLLYVDETENDCYFIVTGLLVNSKNDVALAYKRFTNKAHAMKIPGKLKARVFTEYKSTLLDSRFQRLKVHMLEELNQIDHSIIYSCHVKKHAHFTQTYKETAYMTLLSNIVASISDEVSIIFDRFNKPDFEQRIIDFMSGYPYVQAIMARDSQKEYGLQFVDNLCSVIRLYISGSDENQFYTYIKDRVVEV